MPDIGDLSLNKEKCKYVIDLSNTPLNPNLEEMNSFNLNAEGIVLDYEKIYQILEQNGEIYLRFSWRMPYSSNNIGFFEVLGKPSGTTDEQILYFPCILPDKTGYSNYIFSLVIYYSEPA